MVGRYPLPACAQSLEGLWISDGYGMLLEFSGDDLNAFEITSVSCIQSWTARRASIAGGGQGNVFDGKNKRVRFLKDTSSGKVHMHSDGTVSDVIIRRTATRPKPCKKPAVNTPMSNYMIFWNTFYENYPFFTLHQLDWRVVDRRFRSQVTVSTKPKELFQIFQQMIEPLRDAHTGLVAWDIHEEFDGWRLAPNHLDENQWKEASDIIASKYLKRGLLSFCKGHLQFGVLKDAIGYLRITAFYDYADTPSYDDRLKLLEEALDSIFKGASRWKALVIDVRQNKGGDDALGLAVASRLTKSRYLAYKKVARKNMSGRLRFTPSQEVWVAPSSRPGFYGRVLLLSGPDMVSAGETFAMALMGRKPRAVRIGLNTQGVFSDVLVRTLPNGWHFHLPNEVYYTKDGKSFDGAGIPPDIEVSFFSREDIRNGRDSALDEALKLLTEQP